MRQFQHRAGVDRLGRSICVRTVRLTPFSAQCRIASRISYSFGTPDRKGGKTLTRISSIVLASDQLYTWSDGYTKRIRCRAAKSPQRSCAPTSPAEIDPARFPHRALQALRQAGMQVCRWARTWAEVLSVGKLSRPAAANGLRATGCLRPNSGVSRQLSPKPRDSGDDLRDQPGTSAPPRGALEGHHERVIRRHPRPDRCGIGRRVSRQYARSLDRRRPAEFVLCGGSR
jgi:hypothetical protein